MTVTAFDQQIARLSSGQPLSPAEIDDLARTHDLLPLGMLADVGHRRLHGARVTFVRVATCRLAASRDAVIPSGAGEVRIEGTPGDLGAAVDAVAAVRTVAGDRAVSGLAWPDVERIAVADGAGTAHALGRLRDAGLDAIASLPLDGMAEPAAVVEQLGEAGFLGLRLTIDAAPADARLAHLRQAAALHARFGTIQALNPLPLSLNAYRPTTGYEDVKMVALARLAAPEIPMIQVDWRRYGPKLAQVALTFGADDVDGIAADEAGAEGRRRTPLEEIRRNIEAAGFTAVERDGRFRVRA